MENPKMEQDHSKMVDATLVEVDTLAKAGKVDAALEKMLTAEKITRSSADMFSNSRLLVKIVQMLVAHTRWTTLNEQLSSLSKKHGHMKAAITKMVQEAMASIPKTPSRAEKHKLVTTLRDVTDGKIYIEVEQARLTRMLSDMSEEDGDVTKASEILNALQIETFGSMDKFEKAEFVLEQMRLLLLVSDYPRLQIIHKKISTKIFSNPAPEAVALKNTYYALMIQYALHEARYFDIAKFYMALFATDKISDERAKDCLALALVYCLLAEHAPEQADLLARIGKEPLLQQLPMAKELHRRFTHPEIIRWTQLTTEFGPWLSPMAPFTTLSSDAIAKRNLNTRLHPTADGQQSLFIADARGQERLTVLKDRVVECNLIIIAKYYAKISFRRLGELLDLDALAGERALGRLVVNGSVWARMDRQTQVITFEKPSSAAVLMSEWKTNIDHVLDLISKTNHLIIKEEMVHSLKQRAN